MAGLELATIMYDLRGEGLRASLSVSAPTLRKQFCREQWDGRTSIALRHRLEEHSNGESG